MSPEDTHKPIRFYIGGLILGVNTLYMFFCFFELFAVVGNELITRHNFSPTRSVTSEALQYRMLTAICVCVPSLAFLVDSKVQL